MKQTIFKKNKSKGVSMLDAMGRNSRIILLLLISIALSGSVFGGHSILDLVDPSFNPQIQTNSFGYKSETCIVPLPDGKILVSGAFNSYNRLPVGAVVRVNADGSLDSTFNNSTLVYKPSTDTEAASFPLVMVLQSDGKIVVGGRLAVSGQTGASKPLVRLNADGTLDNTFIYSGNDFSPQDMAIDSANRVIVSTAPAGSLMRLNTDGSPDSSFQLEPGQSVGKIAAQNNKVIVQGFINSQAVIHRLNENGTVDAAFTPEVLNTTGGVKKIIVQPDGKILFLQSNGLQRLKENGGNDGSFASPGFAAETWNMNLSNDGKITVSSGQSLPPSLPTPLQIKRFLADGTADSSFTPYTTSGYGTFGIQTDGGVILGDLYSGGGGTTVPNYFSRLNANGGLDPSFNSGGIGFQSFEPGSVQSIVVQTDQKILISGRFDNVNDSERFKIARLNPDSTLDKTFQINTGGTGDYFSSIFEIYHLALQSDGKVLVSGNFNYVVNGVSKSYLVRLNPDGSIDPTFDLTEQLINVSGSFVNRTNKAAQMIDGKLAVGTSKFSNSGRIPLKLNADGARDDFFQPSIFQTQTVNTWDLAVQTDGKIIIGGRYLNTSGNPPAQWKSFIIRLNADGSTDQSFQVNEVFGSEITAFDLLPNGKILVARCPIDDGTSQRCVVSRLNTDGGVDNLFNAGSGALGKINAILALPTGKIFVGGKFTDFNFQNRQNLAQLNADGGLNPIVYSLNDEVLSLAVDSEGRLLIGGNFTIIGAGGGSGPGHTYMARLIDSIHPNAHPRFDFDGDGRADLGVYNNAAGNWSILNSLTNQGVSTRFGLNGDKTVTADFDGDGKADIAVFRPIEGVWYLLCSTEGFKAVGWGLAEDQPVAGDFDGDGRADLAVWRPSNAIWYVLQSSNNQSWAVKFGLTGDIPLRETDFDGDGRADIAVWRPADGNFYWLESGAGNQFRAVHFGQTGDIPVAADYNGDGKTDLVVFRPAEGNWYQYLTAPAGNYTYSVMRFGLNGDEPVAADYDGDGKTDIAVRRQNVWHLLRSSQGYTALVFANPSDSAIASFASQ